MTNEYFSCCRHDTRTKDHIHGPGACEQSRLFLNYDENITVRNLPLQDHRKKHKSYHQGNFSSLRVHL